jgi:CYTH domain-containing protein
MRVEQAYVALEGDVEVRVRASEDRVTLTVKVGSGLARQEEEVEISHERYQAMRHLAQGRIVTKERLAILRDDGLTIEIDRFSGALAGLVLAEVEFPSLEAAEQFTAPEWFGLEVTDDARYKNRALAVEGLPQ